METSPLASRPKDKPDVRIPSPKRKSATKRMNRGVHDEEPDTKKIILWESDEEVEVAKTEEEAMRDAEDDAKFEE